jgi:hypothetical protein
MWRFRKWRAELRAVWWNKPGLIFLTLTAAGYLLALWVSYLPTAPYVPGRDDRQECGSGKFKYDC